MGAIERTTTGVDAFVFSARAETRTLMLAVAADIVPFVVLVTVSVLSSVSGARLQGAGILLLALAWLAGQGVALARTGRPLGAWALGIRFVEKSTATPAGLRVLPDLFGGRLRACDVRRGRDPITSAVAPFRFPDRAATRHPQAQAAKNAVALLDSGQRLPFARALVIGRNPVTDARGDQRFSWPDLSRTLSKTHARLEWDGEHVWVTDLGSANGSALQTGPELVALEPFVPARMLVDAVLWLGDRSITIAGSRRERRGAAPHPPGGFVVHDPASAPLVESAHA